MNAAFEHIKEVRYLLFRLFESGFHAGADIEAQLRKRSVQAREMALSGGEKMLAQLAETLSALRAGGGDTGSAAAIYSNLITYYQMISVRLISETLYTTT